MNKAFARFQIHATRALAGLRHYLTAATEKCRPCADGMS